MPSTRYETPQLLAFDLLLRTGALTQEELEEANARGHEASFVGGAHAARPNTPVGR